MKPAVSRLVVAAILLPVVLGLVWIGGWALWGFALVAALLAMHELGGVTRALRPLLLAGYAGVALLLVGEQLGKGSAIEWMLGGFLATFVIAFVLNGFAETKGPATVAIGTTILGTAWIGFGLGFLLLVRGVPDHPQRTAYAVLFTVFAADTGAYLFGRLFGRHKLAPAISPGKTWEGFLGGLVLGVAAAFFTLYQTRDTYMPVWQAVVLGLVVTLASVVGDLFESAIKRDMGVKDSGSLLGGHGGVLDRIDSLLFAGPAAFFVLAAFGWA